MGASEPSRSWFEGASRYRPADRAAAARCIVTPEMAELILFDIDARGVATITLNRPERLNAINLEMRDLIWTYLEACKDTPDVRLIVFCGAGAAFSAGADIAEFGTAPSIMEARRARHDRDVWDALIGHRCIMVAALHGYCFGAGLELPLCCDARIAAADARFALPEVTLGYIPSAGGTQTLPRTVPAGVAAHMILSGEAIGTADALRWGLIDRITDGDLSAALDEEVERLLALPRGEATRRRQTRLPLSP